jgi:hypothetical protein
VPVEVHQDVRGQRGLQELLGLPLAQRHGRHGARDAPSRAARRLGDGGRGGGRLGQQQVQQPAAAPGLLARHLLAGRVVPGGRGGRQLVEEEQDGLGHLAQRRARQVVALGLGGDAAQRHPRAQPHGDLQVVQAAALAGLAPADEPVDLGELLQRRLGVGDQLHEVLERALDRGAQVVVVGRVQPGVLGDLGPDLGDHLVGDAAEERLEEAGPVAGELGEGPRRGAVQGDGHDRPPSIGACGALASYPQVNAKCT